MQNKPNFRFFHAKNSDYDEKQTQFKPNQTQKSEKSQNKQKHDNMGVNAPIAPSNHPFESNS